MINWVCLDQRSKDKHQRAAIMALSKADSFSTWGVDQVKVQNKQGFSCFRLVQTEKNNLNSDVLSLAGLEVYGIPTNPEVWCY
jgi:hypothetical protein